ncbi:PIG-L deacetylase family protein [Rhizobium ruizarguesonis]
MKVFAICAHPDDVEIYCLGLLLSLQAQGAEIGWAIATDAFVDGRDGVLPDDNTRRSEAREAAALCGVEPHFLAEQDGLLQADSKLVAKIARLIRKEAPDLVITHSAIDYHADHRALSYAVFQGVSRSAPVLVADSYFGVGFSPNIYIDVTEHFERKIKALSCHRSQRPERLIDDVTLWNRFRAAQFNAASHCYAETYRFDPIFPYPDIRSMLPPSPAIRPR